MSNLLSLADAIAHVERGQVIAYPTESIYGLGCDPDNESAVRALLTLKHRPVEKGLILIADSYQQLLPYIADNLLTQQQKQRIFSTWPGPVTWLLPKSNQTPYFLTGQFHTLAVRVSAHPIVKALCYQLGKPLVSTSANLAGEPPCQTAAQIRQQFGAAFPIVYGELGGRIQPSQIRDSLTGEVIRP